MDIEYRTHGCELKVKYAYLTYRYTVFPQPASNPLYPNNRTSSDQQANNNIILPVEVIILRSQGGDSHA